MEIRQCCEFDILLQAFSELKYTQTRQLADDNDFCLSPAATGKVIVHEEDLFHLLRDSQSGETAACHRRSDAGSRWLLVRAAPKHDAEGRIVSWQEERASISRDEAVVPISRVEVEPTSLFEEIVGQSEPLRQILRQLTKVAPCDSTVLLLGETGTGKELLARALHRQSHRAAKPFIAVNCAAIPQSLIASELFGHEKGAFTGALQRRIGRVEAAEGGTLFLDEVGDLPMETQIALLRVLQERQIERVGSNRPMPVNVRIVAATNQNLQNAVASGRFRQDLFYRLNVFPIQVPALRQRAADIPVLVEYFVDRYTRNAGKKIKQISKRTLELLKAYDWPGNIRELQNVVERAVILCEGDTLYVDESWLARTTNQQAASLGSLAMLADREKEMIEEALAKCKGRISGPAGAAALLQVPRQTLESKISSLGVDKYYFKTRTATQNATV